MKTSYLKALRVDEIPGDAFFEIPSLVYAEDAFWPGENAGDIRQQFSPSNPWFEQGNAWVGCIPGRARLAGFVTPSSSGEPQAHFGFWETLDDLPANQHLFQALSQWAKAKGAARLLGPINFCTLGKYRLRTNPPLCTPFKGEPYNPVWYQYLLENMGFELFVNYTSTSDNYLAVEAFIETLYARSQKLSLGGITLKPLTPALWNEHKQALYQCITKEFSGNTGWTPASEALFSSIFNARTIEPYCQASSSCLAFGPQGEIAGLLFSLDWPEQQTCLLKTIMVARPYRRTRLYAELIHRFVSREKKRWPRLGAALLNITGPAHPTTMHACNSAEIIIHKYALYRKEL